jgi:DNA polymerase I-like protein with 3'-5' exonuclease and polymerase domains
MWELEPQLKDARLLKRSGQKNTKAIRSRVVEKSTELHYTEKGDVAIDADVCKKTEDPLLVTYAKWSVLGSTLHKDVPMLSKGTVYPIHTSYGLAASGRMTSRNPNTSNFGRKGGIRECFVPRPGYVYVGADYPQLELRTVSQVLLEVVGWSKLADSLNAGKDVHCELASTIVRRPYEEVLRGYLDGDEALTETRRVAKAGNFGFPGGMQPAKFVDYCLSQGTPMTEPRGAKIREGWLTTYREFTPYFDWIRRHENRDGTYTVKQLYSNRVRGRMSFTEACNTMFQGLGADCAKYAMYCVSRACYTNPRDALFGSRVVLFVHDELVLEVPEDRVHEAGQSLAHWMAYGANKLLTKVPISVEPVAMRYYSKKAKAVHDANGRLVPWE